MTTPGPKSSYRLFINNSVKSASLANIPDGFRSIAGRFSRNVVRPNGSNSLPSSKGQTRPGGGGGTVLSKPVLVPSRLRPTGAAQTPALPHQVLTRRTLERSRKQRSEPRPARSDDRVVLSLLAASHRGGRRSGAAQPGSAPCPGTGTLSPHACQHPFGRSSVAVVFTCLTELKDLVHYELWLSESGCYDCFPHGPRRRRLLGAQLERGLGALGVTPVQVSA